MLNKILIAALIPFSSLCAFAGTPVETCAWPHVCKQAPQQPAAATPVETCAWPHVCAAAAANPVETCAWPHVCKAQPPIAGEAATPVETCAWPHVCKQA